MKIGRYKRIILQKEMPYKNDLANSLKVSSLHNGLKELLRYCDRNSMAHSREVRLPFLSHKLVEFVFSLPDEFKINQGWTKFILRKAMNNTLPQSICWRIDKIGYEAPQNTWLNSEKMQFEINKTIKALNISKAVKSNSEIIKQDWRLLMTSKYIN
jgi:asparagine synthase (glutamine-hydrolysing)